MSRFLDTKLDVAAKGFLSELGYKSDRTVDLPSSKPEDFLQIITQIVPGAVFDRQKALFDDWTSANLLFQLTDDDISSQNNLFKETSVAPGLLRSYLFFAVELKGDNYSRTKLTGIVRQLNRLFPMPVMVLIKHRQKNPQQPVQTVLSIAVINRAQNKREASKDVMGKVTIIQGISLEKPHRGHEDILESLRVENLKHPQRLPINNFDALHAAWEEIFNVELLNKRFYRELSNWFFWALPQVEFPSDTDEDSERRRATSLIRLLTRLIFCWFLKEKKLIPDDIFVEAEVKKLLKSLDNTDSTFHEGILQNLFFATLNQRMGSNKRGQPYRAFEKDEGFQNNKSTHGVDTLLRYEGHFHDSEEILKKLERVPFLNGGLFECLDRTDEDTGKKSYVDGFSRNPKKRPKLPNHLFFSPRLKGVDLSDAYGEPKRKNEEVRGLIHILDGYKFTIVENTPIDQEIALDPELLGKVFENLLASYNSETKTTARKQTGSFYTPRPIVDYIVDESLKSYLVQVLVSHGNEEAAVKAEIERLLAYTDKPITFSAAEQNILLDAIHKCKILDPACGSGAFPMGMLHKLVHVIHKLDPTNTWWKQKHLDIAEQNLDSKIRKAAIRQVLEIFEENDPDYGRKLYLIENCLFGADIQPIAIQITKLRFFISLIVDQRENRSKDNRGINPLPNLEAKFVAADTLIGLPIPEPDLLVQALIEPIEEKIEMAVHNYFNSPSRKQKLELQKQINLLQSDLAEVITNGLGAMPESEIAKKAKHISHWNRFDAQQTADFFDPQWMFGRTLKEGFDIVIGNPPYQSAIEHKKIYGEKYRNLIKETYTTASGTWDLYIPFFEAGLRFLKMNGTLSYITPNKFLSARYGIGLRSFLPRAAQLVELRDVSHLPIFESASVYPVLSVLRKVNTDEPYDITLSLPVSRSSSSPPDEYKQFLQSSRSLTLLSENLWGFLLSPNLKVLQEVIKNCLTLESVARVCATTTAAEADEFGRYIVPFPGQGWKLLNTGLIDPFRNQWQDSPIRHQGQEILRPVLPDGTYVTKNRRDLFSSPKIIVAKMALRFEGFVDSSGEYAALNCNCISSPTHGWTIESLAALLHSSVVSFIYKQYFDGLRMSGGYMPFQAPQLKLIPIPLPTHEQSEVLGTISCLASSLENIGIEIIPKFLFDLMDACVMECYFHDHMAERDLLFHEQLLP
ncbi:Eco57I restriction-modification methylase domain-containing protein, partial [Coleofasciculus sp. LEGE 07081]|nr:Eco57I restriction-modification methylase domain-containing protein [Coleofasciculus sp. LEGE 07081]